MALSEFEKQRQANIERNKRLLSSLNLNSISNEISQGIKSEVDKEITKKRTRASTTPRSKKVKSEQPIMPTRRSRRIAGIQVDGSDSKSKEFELEAERLKEEREKLEKLKTLRVNGDLSLIDLVKTEGNESEEKLMGKFQALLSNSKNFSIGDYYETISQKDNSSIDVKKLREEFGQKKIYEHFPPNQIKLTPDRMTYITFHPAVDKKLIIGGDSLGHCGIWNSEDTEDVDITSFKLHGKNIAKFEFDINEASKVYTASYDASVRMVDLNTMKSTQFFVNEDNTGISDINFNNDHELYYTTLDGEFGRLDLRANDHSKRKVLRLSVKKIGGFTINPMNKHQIATASLDRTLKIWDIRNVVDSSEWNDIDSLETFHSYGTYDSRLSVSLVDWNHSNDLVCNGYDDTINIFNLGKEGVEWPQDYTLPNNELLPQHKIKHNCQTGRWVSILKARWHKFPQDKSEKFVIANMKKYFDVYDRDGNQLAHLSDPLMTVVPAVANFHPSQNWIVGGGASGKVYLFS